MKLHRRNPGKLCTNLEDSARAKAHRLLDRYMAGDPTPQNQIDWALRMTGDLTADMPDEDGEERENTGEGEVKSLYTRAHAHLTGAQ